MADNRTNAYARAMLDVAVAEGNLAVVEDELYQFARALERSDELFEKLADPALPAGLRQQIVEDLLKGKASNTTVALVSMVVTAGRGKDLPAMVDAMVQTSAAERNRSVAEVRTAVPLTADQQTRLAAALSAATGREVELRTTVDPSVLGGVHAQVGDVVIDGTVRRRIAQLRQVI
ncbi:MAG: ATP synthase F1 subunit delta [Acidimicrobiales bacterium]